MVSLLEEKFREASCIGDTEAILALLTQNIDINSRNGVNGWTALHWAAKRGHENVAKILISHGANTKIQNSKGETPGDICTNPVILSLLDPQLEVPVPHSNANHFEDSSSRFIPNYIRSPSLNGQVDIGRLRTKHPDFSTMPTTSLPATQNEDLVLKVRILGSTDPDFIEIEVPNYKLTYSGLLELCCEELEISKSQVERIRKLPNTRLRKDSDVKRLSYLQSLEIVLKSPVGADKTSNCYQSISTCKDQTILY